MFSGNLKSFACAVVLLGICVAVISCSADRSEVEQTTSDTANPAIEVNTEPLSSACCGPIDLVLSTSTVNVGDIIKADVHLANSCDLDCEDSVLVYLDDEKLTEFSVRVRANGSAVHLLQFVASSPGQHVLEIGTLRREFEAVAPLDVGVDTQQESPEVVRSDVQLHLVALSREKDCARLDFLVEKGKIADWNDLSLPVEVVDDHGNLYLGDLRLELYEGQLDALALVPEGFRYTKSVQVPIPDVAPIESISIDSDPITPTPGEFSLYTSPQSFNQAVQAGALLSLGQWIKISLGEIESSIGGWTIQATVSNTDYAESDLSICVGIQQADGVVTWSYPREISVAAIGEQEVLIDLPIDGLLPIDAINPVSLLLLARTTSMEPKLDFAILGLEQDYLPPAAGQGPDGEPLRDYCRMIDVNEALGTPVSRPLWLFGGEQSSDDMDLLFQEFALQREDSQRTVIIWSSKEDRVYAMPEVVWDVYVDLGGPYYRPSSSEALLGFPVSMWEGSAVFTDGIIEYVEGRPGSDEVSRARFLPPAWKTFDVPISDSCGSLSYSPSGRYAAIVACDTKSTLPYILDTNDWSVRDASREFSYADSLWFSPDAVHIVAHTEDGKLILESFEERHRVAVMDLGDSSYGMSYPVFDSNGDTLAAGTRSGIELWDAGNGNHLSSIPIASASWPSLSPDGGRIAILVNYELSVLDASSGQSIRTLDHDTEIRGFNWSPDGRLLAASGIGFDPPVLVWDTNTGEVIHSLSGHDLAAVAVCFDPTGEILATGSFDHTIKLWNVRTGELIATLLGHSGHVRSVAFSPDGSILISSSSDGTIKIWKVADYCYSR